MTKSNDVVSPILFGVGVVVSTLISVLVFSLPIAAAESPPSAPTPTPTSVPLPLPTVTPTPEPPPPPVAKEIRGWGWMVTVNDQEPMHCRHCLTWEQRWGWEGTDAYDGWTLVDFGSCGMLAQPQLSPFSIPGVVHCEPAPGSMHQLRR